MKRSEEKGREMKRRARYLIGVALVVAIAAITVPAAQAVQQPERPGLADFGLRQDPLYGYRVDGTASPAQVEVISSGDFDWADAGIGAAATLGILLLVGGLGKALVLARNHRREFRSA